MLIFCSIAASKHIVMIRTSFLALQLIAVVCSLCGKDFVSLGHAWRCRSKIRNENTYSASDDTIGMKSTQPVIATNEVKCFCGKKCKGKSKKTGIDCSPLNTLSDTPNNIESQIYLEEQPDLKQGINLPTSS